jgi:hypothetical protein
MDLAPDPTPDPTPFFNEFKDAKKDIFLIFLSYNLPIGHRYTNFSLKN